MSSLTLFSSASAIRASLGGGGSTTKSSGSSNCKPSFFGLEPWYQYLPIASKSSSCQVCFNVLPNQVALKGCKQSSTSDISLVLLAIVDDLLRIAGMVAIIMVLYSSVSYIISQGEPQAIAKARSSIINALIGAAIAMVAIVVVSFIGNKLGGG